MKLYKKVCKTPGTQFRWLTEHGCVWSVSNWFFFPSSDLFKKKSKPYFLRPVLGSHQNWVESTECSHMHSGFRHSQPPPPDQDAPGSGTRATKRIHMDTSWSPNVHSLQKGPLLVSTHSVSLDKSIMTCVYTRSPRIDSLPWKPPGLCFFIPPSIPPNPGNHWSFYILCNFDFSRKSDFWTHTVYIQPSQLHSSQTLA